MSWQGNTNTAILTTGTGTGIGIGRLCRPRILKWGGKADRIATNDDKKKCCLQKRLQHQHR